MYGGTSNGVIYLIYGDEMPQSQNWGIFESCSVAMTKELA